MDIALGCIADDFTGATDLANTLVRAGARTVQAIGVPADGERLPDADAVVIALKSRTILAADALAESKRALDWLRGRGASQVFFKYCSTFDSTPAGNIGPVADALLDALGGDFTIACPAFPGAGRTIYKGYLFVGDGLLSESGMKDHPLTPMTDANLVRLLAAQTPHAVGLIEHATVARGARAITEAFEILRADGVRFAIVDALDDGDLKSIGEAAANLALVTGGSGVAMGLPENLRRAGRLGAAAAPTLPRAPGRQVVLAGSCSEATRAQVDQARDDGWPAFAIDPLAVATGNDVAGAALDWLDKAGDDAPALIHSSAPPETVAQVQAKLGIDAAGALVEQTMGRIAAGLVERDVRRIIVAGGETAGAAVQGLGVKALRIGPEIDPGVPWTEAIADPPLALALKSGNFGGTDFFAKAFGMLP